MLAILHSILHLIKILHKNKNITNVYFFTDSKATLGVFTQHTPFSGLKYIQLILSFFHSSLLQIPHVSFSVKWVPAHYGIQGNELADKNLHIGALFPNSPSRPINSQDIRIEQFHITAHALLRFKQDTSLFSLTNFHSFFKFHPLLPGDHSARDTYLFHIFPVAILTAFFFKST
jgi:hypothetical protein